MQSGRRLGTIFLGIAVLLWGCGSDSASPAPVAYVAIVPAVNSLRAGHTVRLTAVALDSNGNVLVNRPTSWTTSDALIASVTSGNGKSLVTGQGNGTATITATVEGKAAAETLQVWVGVTGRWTGTIESPLGTCSVTQVLTEDGSGAITGTGALQLGPCGASSFTLTGSNGVGGVPDSVQEVWTGSYNVTFSGKFDGTNLLVGVGNGPCGTNCATSLTRTTVATAAPPIPAARGTGSALRSPREPKWAHSGLEPDDATRDYDVVRDWISRY